MRRLALWALACVALVATDGDAAGVRCRMLRGDRSGQCDVSTGAAAAPAYSSFCGFSTVAAAMSGSWGCTNGDLSEPGSSTYDWAGVNSPTPNAGSGTCAAPPYQALVGATPSYVQSTAGKASVTGAFTFCAYVGNTNANTNVSPVFWGQYPCCGSYTTTTEQSNLTFYPGGASGVTIDNGDRALVCHVYNGSGSTSGYIRINGDPSSVFVTAVATPANSALSRFIFGTDGTSAALTGNFYGGFFTETALSQAQLDAIFLQVVECT